LAPATEFKVTRAGDVALVTIDNGEDWTKPTFFGEAALDSLRRALDELERGGYRAAVITGKPFFFAAGADITEFPNITRERAVEGARAGHELFGKPHPLLSERQGALGTFRPGFEGYRRRAMLPTHLLDAFGYARDCWSFEDRAQWQLHMEDGPNARY